MKAKSLKIQMKTYEEIFYPVSSQGLSRTLIYKRSQQLLTCAKCELEFALGVGIAAAQPSVRLQHQLVEDQPPDLISCVREDFRPRHSSHLAYKCVTASCSQTSFPEVRTHFPASNAIIDF